MDIQQAKLLDALLSEFKGGEPVAASQLIAIVKKVGVLGDDKIVFNFDFLIEKNMLKKRAADSYEISPSGKIHIDGGGFTSHVKNELSNNRYIKIAAWTSAIAAAASVFAVYLEIKKG